MDIKIFLLSAVADDHPLMIVWADHAQEALGLGCEWMDKDHRQEVRLGSQAFEGTDDAHLEWSEEGYRLHFPWKGRLYILMKYHPICLPSPAGLGSPKPEACQRSLKHRLFTKLEALVDE